MFYIIEIELAAYNFILPIVILFRQFHRFALLVLGRAWTLFESRKNSKPEKCSKTPHAAKRQTPASSARFVGQNGGSDLLIPLEYKSLL